MKLPCTTLAAVRRVAACAALVLAACSSDRQDGPAAGQPLSLAAGAPRAYGEAFLAANPATLLRAGHIAVMRLEPAGRHDGDTGEEGVDRIAFLLEQPARVGIAADAGMPHLQSVVLRHPSGQELARHERGEAPAQVELQPGVHLIELYHARKGDASTRHAMVFVRIASPVAGTAPATGSVAKADAAAVQAITAGHDCTGCDLRLAMLDGMDFSGVRDFSGSDFSGASLRSTRFVHNTMTGCRLGAASTTVDGASQSVASTLESTDFTGASLSNAVFDGMGGIGAVFTQAVLDGSSWRQAQVIDVDFTDASLRFAKFTLAQLNSVQFNGADLSGADFSPHTGGMNGMPPRYLDFSRSPRTGKATYLGKTDFTGVPIYMADFSQANLDGTILRYADLSNANLSGARVAADLSWTHLNQATITTTTDFSAARLSDGAASGARFRAVRFPARFGQFQRRDLRFVDFTGASLVQATLDGALVQGTVFTDADLTGAQLAGLQPSAYFAGEALAHANFSGVDFTGIDLSRADFSGVTLSADTKLAGAVLSDGVSRGIDLSGQQFPPLYAQLAGKDLRYANLANATLAQADLQGARLDQAQLVGANLSYANLKRATLVGARLGVGPGAAGRPASLVGAYMPDVDLTDADLRSVNLTGAHVYGDQQASLLVRTRLDSADLTGANLAGARFGGSLASATFNDAILVDATFNGADLTNAKFDSAYLQGADFSTASSLTGVSLINAAVSTAAGAWTFTERDGTPFTFGYAATRLGALASSASVYCPSGDSGPCVGARLVPVKSGPYPPQPACVPLPPRYNNCLPPAPSPQ